MTNSRIWTSVQQTQIRVEPWVVDVLEQFNESEKHGGKGEFSI